MKLSTSTNILYERADGSRIPVDTSIRMCADAGYQEMDFCFVDQIFGKTEFLTDTWESFLARHLDMAQKRNIQFTQTHCGIYNFCNGIDPWQEELNSRCIRGTAMLGAPWMVVHPATLVTGGKEDPTTMDRNVEYFRRLSEEAGRWNVGIAIENMWGKAAEGVPRFAIRGEELLELIERIDAENVGACWDVEHGSIEGLDQGAAIRLLGHHLKATHISDQTAANNIHILPYTGFVDWDDVLHALADINYSWSFAYELQHYLLYMPMELVPEALRMSVSVGEYLIRRMESFRSED